MHADGAAVAADGRAARTAAAAVAAAAAAAAFAAVVAVGLSRQSPSDAARCEAAPLVSLAAASAAAPGPGSTHARPAAAAPADAARQEGQHAGPGQRRPPALQRPFLMTAEEVAGGVSGDLGRLRRWLAAAGGDAAGVDIAASPAVSRWGMCVPPHGAFREAGILPCFRDDAPRIVVKHEEGS